MRCKTTLNPNPKNKKLGMFPLRVLNVFFLHPFYVLSLLRTVSIRGNIPTLNPKPCIRSQGMVRVMFWEIRACAGCMGVLG